MNIGDGIEMATEQVNIALGLPEESDVVESAFIDFRGLRWVLWLSNEVPPSRILAPGVGPEWRSVELMYHLAGINVHERGRASQRLTITWS